MKIIIAYTSAGAGHAKAAEALYEHFRKRNRRLQLELVDVLEQSDFIFRKVYASGYTFMVKHVQWLWKVIYHITSQKRLQPPLTRVRSLHNRARVRGFIDQLIREDPDVIIATHFLPAAIAACLKEEGKITSRLCTVITDFCVHPFWVYEHTDLYCVASELTARELIDLGVDRNTVTVTGIPVDEKFLKDFDKRRMRDKLSLDPDAFTVLVVTGSFGIGPVEQIVSALHGHVQLIVVCARNKRLYARLKAKKYARTRVFGFVDDIEELMAAADCVVTKPGGLSISELLAMELPPVFISAIPGQEAENVRVLGEYGIGLVPGRRAYLAERSGTIQGVARLIAAAVKQKVLSYMRHPQKLKEVQERIRAIKQPGAAGAIYRAVC
jgi:processive 1,2-diacylglycerol beta-glucosyltransferase